MSEDIGFYSKKRGIKMIKDLTVGKPGAVLWRFSLPMFVGVIFQRRGVLRTPAHKESCRLVKGSIPDFLKIISEKQRPTSKEALGQ